jgi:hypothetical protein
VDENREELKPAAEELLIILTTRQFEFCWTSRECNQGLAAYYFYYQHLKSVKRKHAAIQAPFTAGFIMMTKQVSKLSWQISTGASHACQAR